MSYKIYSYENEDVWNFDRDATTIKPSDILLDPFSNGNTLIITAVGDTVYRYVIEGQFQYNFIKQTLADVTRAITTSITQYENGIVTQKEIFENGFDLFIRIFGTARDMLPAYAGDDYFAGSPTSQQDDGARGYTGNDTFVGYGDGQYGDYFNGESGFDIAILRGAVSDYTITRQNIYDELSDGAEQLIGYKVIDSRQGRDGIDYYANVERLYFSDKVVALDIDGNAGQAYRLYKAALDRVPDAPGLAGWIDYKDNGGDLHAMAQMFIDSPEFIAKYGAMDNAAFINQLYLNVLDRNADGAGLAGWQDAMANGASRAHVLIGFSESTENQANVIGQIQNGITYTEFS